jgi:hypothetical protein
MSFDLDTLIGDCLAAAPDQASVTEVVKPTSTASAAIHVYGGPLFDQPRHMWEPDETPIDGAAYLDRFLAELRVSGCLSEPN